MYEIHKSAKNSSICMKQKLLFFNIVQKIRQSIVNLAAVLKNFRQNVCSVYDWQK